MRGKNTRGQFSDQKLVKVNVFDVFFDVKVLREEIVNPLRRDGYVASDATHKLRCMMDRLTDSRGRYTRDQKDPEEFIRDLFKHVSARFSL